MQLTARSRLGSVVGIVGALAVSCQGSGSGCVTGPTTPPDPPVLRARYVLFAVQPPRAGSVPVPGIYDDSAGFRLRADADTLVFSPDSTFREVGQTALVAANGTATIRPQATGTPAPRYSVSPGPGSLALPLIMGRQVSSASYYGPNLTVLTRLTAGQFDGPTFYYEAR